MPSRIREKIRSIFSTEYLRWIQKEDKNAKLGMIVGLIICLIVFVFIFMILLVVLIFIILEFFNHEPIISAPMDVGKAVVMYLAFIGLLIVLGYVIIKINKTTKVYIGDSESDKKSVSKRLIVVGLIFIILGIILGNFSYGASSKAGGVFLVFVFLAFIGFLVVLYGMGLYPAPPGSEDLPL